MNFNNLSGFKQIEGITCFSKDRYWGKAPEETMKAALGVIEKSGWEKFLKMYAGKFDFTFDWNRADWRFPVSVSKKSVVLDIGAGMGRISVPLALVAGRVVAVDQSFLRMKFLKKRAEAEGLKNVEVYVGDLFDLPFPEESFDLIVMNGVLEWVGMTERFKKPREAQLAALAICRRLLKKGGYLYVGIENRWALSYLKGVDHSGLRFTSYMPRFLANWYMALRGRSRYSTYTYGARGYRKLLQEAGFSDPEFYLPYPGYNNPRVVIPYGDLNLLSYVIGRLMSKNNARRFLLKLLSNFKPSLYLYRKLFFSYNIFVRK